MVFKKVAAIEDISVQSFDLQTSSNKYTLEKCLALSALAHNIQPISAKNYLETRSVKNNVYLNIRFRYSVEL